MNIYFMQLFLSRKGIGIILHFCHVFHPYLFWSIVWIIRYNHAYECNNLCSLPIIITSPNITLYPKIICLIAYLLHSIVCFPDYHLIWCWIKHTWFFYSTIIFYGIIVHRSSQCPSMFLPLTTFIWNTNNSTMYTERNWNHIFSLGENSFSFRNLWKDRMPLCAEII